MHYSNTHQRVQLCNILSMQYCALEVPPVGSSQSSLTLAQTYLRPHYFPPKRRGSGPTQSAQARQGVLCMRAQIGLHAQVKKTSEPILKETLLVFHVSPLRAPALGFTQLHRFAIVLSNDGPGPGHHRPEEGVVFQMGGSRSRGSSRVIHILSNLTWVHKGVRNLSRVLASNGTLRAEKYSESTLNARLGAPRVTTKLHTPSAGSSSLAYWSTTVWRPSPSHTAKAVFAYS